MSSQWSVPRYNWTARIGEGVSDGRAATGTALAAGAAVVAGFLTGCAGGSEIDGVRVQGSTASIHTSEGTISYTCDDGKVVDAYSSAAGTAQDVTDALEAIGPVCMGDTPRATATQLKQAAAAVVQASNP
ncbi:MAG TPA: hypothetical protein VMY99_03725 [Nevskiaceae bacterium]|nr:hypothetical protein [Nevskiaceae bacterium]